MQVHIAWGGAVRLAVMHARGEVTVGETLTMRSVRDGEFQGAIAAPRRLAVAPAVWPRIAGRA